MAQRLKTDPETVERDLIKLVLTIVELLRQLMERMTELCERYDLTMADLNLDLGPLGSLLPRTE
jgi:hypothetical protein